MTHPNVHPENPPGEWIDRRADLIVVGDRIAQEFLPLWGDQDAEAIFVKPTDTRGTRRIFIAFAQDDGYHDSMSLLPESVISVLPAPTGLDHSRADDGEDPQQIGKRVEPHTGGVKSGIATDGHRVGDPVITGDLAGPKGWHRKGCHGATGLPCTCEPTHCGCGGELHEGVCVSCGSAVRAVASES